MKQEDIDFWNRVDPKKECGTVLDLPLFYRDVVIGGAYLSKTSGIFKVVEKLPPKQLKVRFVESGYEKVYYFTNVKTGTLKDPFYRSVLGIGYMGIGPYSSYDSDRKTHSRSYVTWRNMLHRLSPGVCEPYSDCSVSEEWKCYQIFAEWYENQPGSNLDGWEIEKDFLKPNNRVYCAENCCLLPKAINNFIRSNKHLRHGLPIGVNVVKSGGYRAVVSSKHGHVKGPTRKEVEIAAEDYFEIKLKMLKDFSSNLVKQENPSLHEFIMSIDENHLKEMS